MTPGIKLFEIPQRKKKIAVRKELAQKIFLTIRENYQEYLPVRNKTAVLFPRFPVFL
jgi:hypothetical protein